MLSPATIDRIRSAIDIVDVVQDYIALTKRGAYYRACCPFHEEKTPSFHVSPAKNIFKCFGCGKGGSAIDFVMEHEHVTYIEAMRILAKKYHIEIEEKEPTPQERQHASDRESMMAIAAFAAQFFIGNLNDTQEGKTIAQPYLLQRGIPKHIADRFQLGYSPQQRDALASAAIKAGYKQEFLIKTGLCFQQKDGSLADRFAARIMFPIHSIGGRIIGFGGRTMHSDKSIAKYINSPESDIYHKSDTLYGIFYAKKSITQQDKCYLVEGYTDAISMHAAGIENVAASSGTSLTKEQIRMLGRFTKNVSVLYDGDAAGIKASMRGIDMLLEEGINVKSILLPQGEDPDSFSKSRSASDFAEYLHANEQDFIAFKIKILLKDAGNDPIKRAAAASSVVQSIAIIADALTRSIYIAQCAKLIGMDEETLAQEVGRIRRKRYFNEDKAAEHAGAQSSHEQAFAPHAPPQESIPPNPDIYKCKEQERELVYYLLKYGQCALFDGMAAAYIIAGIDDDGIMLRNADYALLYEEYKRLYISGGDTSGEAFLHHENHAVRRLAADLLSSKYTPSRLWDIKGAAPMSEEEQLESAIPKLITAYKARVVELAIREKTKLLEELFAGSPEDEHEGEECIGISSQIAVLDSLRNDIAKALQRVIP
jgi:DNA primase